ncbi:MAG: MBL fold metallo-hydrolase [Lachnospiraceae bacterium]|nr:MBL fold metallo-hydrolase [Lachnospiraceae bacterium]
MKKYIILPILLLSLLFTGCDSGNGDPAKDNTPKPSETNSDPGDAGDLEMFFFEMGKADAFLIYNKKTAILIDTGEKGQGKDILQYMENNNIASLDYLIITHFDQDHVGGANKVLGNIAVKQIYTSNYPKESEEYNTFMGRVKEKSIPTTVLREDISFDINGIKVEIDAPEREVYEADPSNNSSLIVRITYKDNSFVFMGDAMSDRIREYIATDPKSCDVLKMPYHGKFMGCLSELIDKLKPKYAVITSSKEDKEADETKDLLESANVKLYRTRKGGVHMQSDGKEISVFQGA